MAKRWGLTQQLQVKIRCVTQRLELAVLDAVKPLCTWTDFKTPSSTSWSFTSTPPFNCKHSWGRCCLLQCCTEHKMVGQQAQGNMWPWEAFPHCHAHAAQNRDLRWARAASQRYSETPAIRRISKVSRLHHGCNKRAVNTQEDLSEWQTMYHGHGYHHGDHSDNLKLTQTWERTLVQEVQRGLLWRNRYSSGGTTELLQGLWS